ncbi:MAG: isoleucine--tRNA ligase [Christensenellales bacterium]|jgi:isoleucyl-tRNA synthetase
MKKENGMPNFVKNEEEILAFWQENQIFNKLRAKNENTGNRFRFLDGPITANNKMGVHHAWNRSLKDFMHRYKAMNGFSAQYQNGFDAQGLWVEVEVEKELGLKDKTDIEKLGLARFTESCVNRVDKYSKIITEQSKRLGQWMDWDNSYYTNSDNNITSIWHFLKVCEERGWLVQKYRPMPWCPHCGTSLSEHELADSYLDMEHDALFVKMPIKGTDEEILVWTTTPWTLPANVAVAVHPELEYSVCKVKSTDKKLIVASSLIKVLKGDLVEVVKTLKGQDLVGKVYQTCFPNLAKQNFDHKIVAWDMVSAEDGAGSVHIAPGCGAEDFELGSSLGLESIIPVDEQGIFFNDFGIFAGKKTSEVNDLVFEELKKNGVLYYTHKHLHRYPICWRCKTPLIYRLTKEWYIKADEIRPQLIAACDQVEWQPEFLKKRMVDWLTNMGDWNISRKRFYGLPLPIYICDNCEKRTVVGSREELERLAANKEKYTAMPRLHRPYIDEIEIKCPHCNHNVKRVSEVGDCWLDAGITPFSTKKYFTDKDYFNNNFPSEVVVEMKEQIRLWFYAILFMSVTLEGKAPYEKVIGFAMLVSEDGSKFSKSGKNNIALDDAAARIGADVIRYMFASNNMINDTRFGYGIGDEIRRKLLGLWNAYVFFNTYALLDKPELEGFVPDVKTLDNSDLWLLSRTREFVKNARESFDNHVFHQVTKEFEVFVDDLTNWYIRINRKRFWKSDDEADKKNAYYTLYTSIKTAIQVIAPITPYLSEYIWQNMVKNGMEPASEESIFLSNYPQVENFVFDEKILSQTAVVREVITLAQRLRNESQIKIKQPLKNLYITASVEDFEAIKAFENTIKDELNIKELVLETNANKFNQSYLTINFKTAGAVLKGNVQALRQALIDMPQDQMDVKVEQFNQGKVSFEEFGELDANLFILNFKPKQDFLIAHENNITLVLDTSIDESLMLEGLYRELVRQIQVLRKEAGFKIEDRIFVGFETQSESLNVVINQFKEKIMAEALIKDVLAGFDAEISQSVAVGGEDITISLKRVEK